MMMMIDLKKAVWLGMLVLGVWTAGPQPVVSAQEQASTRRGITKKVPPVYPAIARQARLSGTVKLVLIVTPDGTVKSLRTVGGNPVLAVAAEEAVKQWKFEVSKKESIEPVAVAFESP